MHNQVWHIFDTTKHRDHTFISIATEERQQKTITQEKTLYVNERTRMKISHPRRFTSMHRLSFYIEEILPYDRNEEGYKCINNINSKEF